MGKRQRRRSRQQNKNIKRQPVVFRYLIPNAEAPLLEVMFEPDVSDQDKAVCLDYWSFDEPGTWSHKVAEIGANAVVLRTVKASCRAALLTIVCPGCAGPQTVASRSEVTASRLWAADVFPRTAITAKAKCQACREAEVEALRQERLRAEDEQRAETEERVSNASAWVADHSNREYPEEDPDLGQALALLTITEIMERTDSESFGPLRGLDCNLTESTGSDGEALRELYKARWIAPTLPATIGDFAFEEDNTVRGVYIDQVPWRLAHALGSDARRARQVTAARMRQILLDNVGPLELLLRTFEATMAVDYLDGLLTRKYNEEPIPDHRLPDAHHTFVNALKDGFSLGQLIAVAWSATASSVAWGQRTPGLRPGSVSSASVTNLERRIGYAKDRPVAEYDVPNWVNRPAAHATALRVLEQHTAEAEAMSRFLRLRQRIASRNLETDFDLDMAEASPHNGLPVDDLIDDLLNGTGRLPSEPPITYALVTPDRELEFHTTSPHEMRDKVSLAGAGHVDRISLHEPSTVNAYVGELVPASDKTANPVAGEMLRLLDCHDGPFYGPVSFFAVGAHPGKPRSLDEEQQEMLRAVHEVAVARTK